MRERHVGSSGLVASVVGLGCNNFGWRLGEKQTSAVVDAALGAGITFFDTAESYGSGQSELYLGRALAGRRDRAVIATKFGWGRGFGDNDVARGSPGYIRAAIDRSLQKLGTDHVDLYQYHRPDGVTPIEETLGAMHELVVAGKVRYVGSSNLSAAEVEEADRVARAGALTPFVSAQNDYSWLVRDAEDDLVPALERLGLGLIPYFPLASGLLTGKYRRGKPPPEGTRLAEQGLRFRRAPGVPDEVWDRIERLEEWARGRGLRLLDVAIGGLAAQPTVSSVIAGATTPEQARANAAAGEWEPSPAELGELRAL
jgi:aryl-alcohol dehydrogenase-like predicted oxidoreductase